MSAAKPPRGFKFDAFADVRMGKSLFEMRDADWLVPEREADTYRDKSGCQLCDGYCHGGCREQGA